MGLIRFTGFIESRFVLGPRTQNRIEKDMENETETTLQGVGL